MKFRKYGEYDFSGHYEFGIDSIEKLVNVIGKTIIDGIFTETDPSLKPELSFPVTWYPTDGRNKPSEEEVKPSPDDIYLDLSVADYDNDLILIFSLEEMIDVAIEDALSFKGLTLLRDHLLKMADKVDCEIKGPERNG